MANARRCHDIERAGTREHELKLGERLDCPSEAAARPAHALGDRLELAVMRRQQRQHAVRLAQLKSGEDDRFGVIDTWDRHSLVSLPSSGSSLLVTTRYHVSIMTTTSPAEADSARLYSAPVLTSPDL